MVIKHAMRALSCIFDIYSDARKRMIRAFLLRFASSPNAFFTIKLDFVRFSQSTLILRPVRSFWLCLSDLWSTCENVSAVL